MRLAENTPFLHIAFKCLHKDAINFVYNIGYSDISGVVDIAVYKTIFRFLVHKFYSLHSHSSAQTSHFLAKF